MNMYWTYDIQQRLKNLFSEKSVDFVFSYEKSEFLWIPDTHNMIIRTISNNEQSFLSFIFVCIHLIDELYLKFKNLNVYEYQTHWHT